MTTTQTTGTTRNSKVIRASPDRIYKAFTDPRALAVWLAPGEMTGTVHEFDLRVGGGYTMSLFYPASELTSRGKTQAKEDRYRAQFIELTPPRKIVEAIRFDTGDPKFSGEMTMEVTLEPENSGTRVTIIFRNLPSGILPDDNGAGTASSLQKLARYLE